MREPLSRPRHSDRDGHHLTECGSQSRRPLNAAQRRKLKSVFDEIDTDGSDDLDYQELKNALVQYGIKLSVKELKDVWIAADKDASSGISFDEFVTAVEVWPNNNEQLPLCPLILSLRLALV